MELDENNRDRSYLFGRLLAVADMVEREALERSKLERETNAVRSQAAFVQCPFKIYENIEKALKPYYDKLKPWRRKDYRKLTDHIFGLLEENNQAALNRPLSEMYLLGYHLQRRELNTYSKQNFEEDN